MRRVARHHGRPFSNCFARASTSPSAPATLCAHGDDIAPLVTAFIDTPRVGPLERDADGHRSHALPAVAIVRQEADVIDASVAVPAALRAYERHRRPNTYRVGTGLPGAGAVHRFVLRDAGDRYGHRGPTGSRHSHDHDLHEPVIWR